MTNIKAIIHDWDDVITNSFEVYSQFYFDVAKLHNLETPSIENIRKYWGDTIENIAMGQWPYLSGDEAKRIVHETIHSEKRSKTSYKIKVFPGVKNTLSALSEKYKLGVLSSGRTAAMEIIYKRNIKRNGYYHDFILDALDTPVHKPNPQVFDKVFELLNPYGITEQETVYVGDHLYDWFAARDRGMLFYAITTGVKSKEDFVDEGLEEQYILEKFSDLLKVF